MSYEWCQSWLKERQRSQSLSSVVNGIGEVLRADRVSIPTSVTMKQSMAFRIDMMNALSERIQSSAEYSQKRQSTKDRKQAFFSVVALCVIISCCIGWLEKAAAASDERFAEEPAGNNQSGRIDVTRYGVLPGRDVSEAFQQLVKTSSNGAIFIFPAGNFEFTRTVDIAQVLFQIEGVGVGAGTGAGTTFTANFAGPIMRYKGRKTFRLEGIEFRNKHAQGSGFEAEACQMSEVSGCHFGPCGGTGFRSNHSIGLGMIRTSFSQCGVGLANVGHVLIENGNFTRNVEGARLSHMSAAIIETRWEVNGTALRLGIKPDGKSGVLSNLTMSSFTMEANDKAIEIHNASGEISNGHIYGTGGSPSGASRIGMEVKGGGLFVHNLNFNGGFVVGDVVLRSTALGGVMKWQQVNARNMVDGVNNPDRAWLAEVDGNLVRFDAKKHALSYNFDLTNWNEPHPIVVTLSAPLGEVSTRTPTFTWMPLQNATTYHIKCVERVLGSRPIVFSKKKITDTTYTPAGVTFEAGKAYTWQVRAMLVDGSYSSWRTGKFLVSPDGPISSGVNSGTSGGTSERRRK